jgi:hypothetical protein
MSPIAENIGKGFFLKTSRSIAAETTLKSVVSSFNKGLVTVCTESPTESKKLAITSVLSTMGGIVIEN